MRSSIFFVLPAVALAATACANDQEDQDAVQLLQSHRVAPTRDIPDGPDEHGRVYSDAMQHRIDRQAQQVTARVTTDATNGYLEWAKYSQHRVCVAATQEAITADMDYYVPEWTLEEPLCFNKLSIGYLSGAVTCRNAEHGTSHFGCDADSIGLVLAKKNTEDNYDVVFPKPVRATQGEGESGCAGNENCQWNVDNIEGYSFMGHGHADWYKLSTYTADPTRQNIQLKLNPNGEGGVFLPKGTYRLWYHEDLTAGTESDNDGIACYHLDFELCQGTHDAEWSISSNSD